MSNKPYTIVVGFDFSDLADRALAEALNIAGQHAVAEVHVIAVIPPIEGEPLYTMAGFPVTAGAQPLSHVLDSLKAHVHSKVLELSGPASGAGPRVPSRIASHTRVDSPVFGIVQFASEIEASLIVIGTHGRRGLTRWLLGSVAEGVVRHSECPVLVIPSPAAHGAEVPKIEPPCPACVQVRAETKGEELWCAQHRERHGRRHTYHQGDRASASANHPLIVR